MIRIGMIIGDRYEIQEKVGTGGMSDVYRALDHKLNRPVAVKVLKQEFSENQNFVAKFRTEAQAAAGLMHPNIVNVYDVGNDKGVYYIVMELVDGITLKKYIEKKSRLTVREAVSIGIQVAMGLDAAHKNGIIHRDIKPQNIIISKDGKVKVTDFGIAKAASSNTITSNVMGSVHYTSPEQARGGFSDAKSDIYSLGVSLFEMVTGRVPYNGDTTVAIAIKHIQEPFPSPREYAPDLPISVEKIIMKCCQKSPDRRYQNAPELIKDLKRSLITPDEDFVVLVDPDEEGATRIATDGEQEMIRHGATGTVSRTEQMRLREDDIPKGKREADSRMRDRDADARMRDADGRMRDRDADGRMRDNDVRMRESMDERDAYPPQASSKRAVRNEGDYEDTYDAPRSFRSGTRARNSGKRSNPEDSLNKIMIVMGAVAAVLIIIIILFAIGNSLGGNSSSGSDSASSASSGASGDESGIIVPDVVGKSYVEAKTTLQDKGFVVEKTDDESSTQAKNVVTTQSVTAKSRAASGSTITLGVSTGANHAASTKASSSASSASTADKKIAMPNVLGMDESTARLTLVENGFDNAHINVIEVNSDDASLTDTIINQTPTVGTSVSVSSSVNLELSIGPSNTTTYSYSGSIDAPTEDSYYTAGTTVNLTITSADGTLLLSTATSTFPFAVSPISGITSSTGTLEMNFVVTTPITTDPTTGAQSGGTTETRTVTRTLTFTPAG